MMITSKYICTRLFMSFLYMHVTHSWASSWMCSHLHSNTMYISHTYQSHTYVRIHDIPIHCKQGFVKLLQSYRNALFARLQLFFSKYCISIIIISYYIFSCSNRTRKIPLLLPHLLVLVTTLVYSMTLDNKVHRWTHMTFHKMVMHQTCTAL